MIADVVGYSRLMSVDEESTHLRLSDYIKNSIEPKISEHGGRLIRSAGDGLLVEFDSAVEAVYCALEIHHELAEHDAGIAADRRLRLRIGINAGDVIADNQDIYGNSVNIAARLEAVAGPGEIYAAGVSVISCRATPTWCLRTEDNEKSRVSASRSASIACGMSNSNKGALSRLTSSTELGRFPGPYFSRTDAPPSGHRYCWRWQPA